MLKSGLVSITFRKLSFSEIITLVNKAGLAAIEWGGDIHSPHGDLNKARQVRKATVEAGIEIAAYGSYYVVGHSNNEGLDFKKVLDTAAELKAPVIRVWAGKKGSAESDAPYWNNIVSESQKIAELAAAARINLSFEYHCNTLADTAESSLRLIRDILQDNFTMYWQPVVGADVQRNTHDLNLMLSHIPNVHVFCWNSDRTRCLLSQGITDWKNYLQVLSSINKNCYAMLEFVKDDSVENFLDDAKTLKGLL
jgi:sugar phosphate isomerase/epimerase